ncbi:hypothetical protein BDV25DRAFT_137045 [Aspergillus avenaceus]|uniref:Uncharacterized protein n=1 Tax=Aspergillus avenaceus TaxID=36643 RepID=A0A5N6U450_ASPAV|nr:hypothetical protein BDV25DRAFT_137045 [Aspergillus avenaceus]
MFPTSRLQLPFALTVSTFLKTVQGAVLPPSDQIHGRQMLGPFDLLGHLSKRSEDNEASGLFRSQFSNPKEVLSVLLLIGGDVIQKAVAQMAGPTFFTPVAFSFGWVSYSFNSLMDAVGDGTYLPEPDYPGSVVVVGSGDTRKNQAWVIGRLIRDLEMEVENGFSSKWQDEATNEIVNEGASGLLITVYESLPARQGNFLNGYAPKEPKKDALWWTYFPITLTQLVVGAIPWITSGNWAVFFVTACGIVLALVTGSLRTLFQEKYVCRDHSRQIYAITRGNGHRHVFLILPNSRDGNKSSLLYLDDLASAVQHGGWKTRLISIMLATLWIGFLVTVGGIDQSTWYLLGIGGLGMVHNVFVAGWHRASEAHGIPLQRAQRIRNEFGRRKKGGKRPRVMDVLLELEDAIPEAGLSLIDLFFPGALRPEEIQIWQKKKDNLEDRKSEWKQKKYPKEKLKKEPTFDHRKV